MRLLLLIDMMRIMIKMMVCEMILKLFGDVLFILEWLFGCEMFGSKEMLLFLILIGMIVLCFYKL